MAEYRFEVPEDMRAQAEPGMVVPDAVVVTLDPAIYHGCMVPATESRQGARNGPKAAMDTDSSNGAPGAPVGASNGRT